MNSTGTASGSAWAVALSPNGRYVLFGSIASDLVATPKGTTPTACGGGPCFDVFVRDLKLGTTTLVSVNSTGTASGNANSNAVALSPNGRYVLFNSDASDLVANDTIGSFDVFVRYLKLGTTTLVSVNSTGTASGNADSEGVVLSPNGRYVLFESIASDLVANDANGSFDVFVRDLKRGTTTLVSVNSTGTAGGNSSSVSDSFSANGRYVLFDSIASDLVATPKGTTPTACGGGPCFDVFVRDLKLGTTTLVSVNSTGTASGNAVSAAVGLTPNGQYVLFNSSASDLVATPACGGGPCSDVFVRQLR